MKSSFRPEDKRTHYAAELSAADIGKRVCVAGWAQRQRDLGSLIFIDLRDRTGIVQLIFDDTTDRAVIAKAKEARSEYVLMARGTVLMREAPNPEIPTGYVEIYVTELRLLAGDQPAADARRQTGSRRLAALLETLRQEADFIVLDTPPCGLVADSAAMARSADGIIYVLRSGVAQVSHVMDNLQLLSDSGTRLMGCVLNGSHGSRGGYGYGYGYGYGGYYGKYSSRHGKRMEEKDKGSTV